MRRIGPHPFLPVKNKYKVLIQMQKSQYILLFQRLKKQFYVRNFSFD